MKRLIREKNRACDGCDFKGEVFLVAIGNKSFRGCNSCISEIDQLRKQAQANGYDSVETTR